LELSGPFEDALGHRIGSGQEGGVAGSLLVAFGRAVLEQHVRLLEEWRPVPPLAICVRLAMAVGCFTQAPASTFVLPLIQSSRCA
jgi:hypothetical protein